MNLSQSFSIDVQAPWVKKHNAEAQEVVQAHQADKPIRVPLLCGDASHQHGFYADEIGLDYEVYYTNPDEMVRVQLESARRRRELPVYDFVLGQAPKSWAVSVDLHPVYGPGWFGCELMYRKDSVIAHKSLKLSRQECRDLAMPDPRNGGLLKTCQAFSQQMKERYEGHLQFLGRPVGPFGHGVCINGILCIALDLRGPDIMSDMYEAPEFARELLMKITEWWAALDRAWGGQGGPFGFSDHGIDMLSPKLYEKFMVPVIKGAHRRCGKPVPTALHHCGRGVHLFPIMKRHFGLTSMDALTFPLVDIARVRRELGEDIWIVAGIADEIVRCGPPERIRQTVKDLMESGAKGKGRFALSVGDMMKGTPMEHREVLYESVKEFGRY